MWTQLFPLEYAPSFYVLLYLFFGAKSAAVARCSVLPRSGDYLTVMVPLASEAYIANCALLRSSQLFGVAVRRALRIGKPASCVVCERELVISLIPQIVFLLYRKS